MDEFTQMIPTTPAEPPNGQYKFVENFKQGMGKQLLAEYSNGYGASVVQHSYSYGGPEGKYELAVTHASTSVDINKGQRGDLCYATPITNDVIGWLDEEAVVATLHQIFKLPINNNCSHAPWSITDELAEN